MTPSPQPLTPSTAPCADQLTNTFRGRKVFVTGHTGFKGSWLCEWLLMLGAKVTGYSLPPPTAPALFHQLGLEDRLRHIEADVRDAGRLREALTEASPDFVFHLAAQPLVRLSYREPVETYATNVFGTINVLEVLRAPEMADVCAVFVTTDKVYENREWVYGYREEDPLGGYDPYSSSKACAEIAVAAWRQSFLSGAARIASARAGNVIGGGDWALDRIVPDAIRSLSRGEKIPVRNPAATRPWQHVLEPLSGYLSLAAHLAESGESDRFACAFNFGPALTSNRSVRELVEEAVKHWPGDWEDRADPGSVHEAGLLNLVWDKAHHLLEWQPRWGFEETIRRTVQWYRSVHLGSDPLELTRTQIAEYHGL